MTRAALATTGILCALLATCWVLAFRLDGYSVLVLTLVALTTVVGVGLNVLIGLSGQISFGHVAFYALGAYASALLGMAGVPLPVALVAAGALAGAAGLLLSIPAIRVSGAYLAMVTIAFAFMVHHGLMEWRSLTGGANGLLGIPAPDFGAVDTGVGLALLASTLAAVALGGYHSLVHSGWGRAMRAVKSSEIAARSIGIDPVAAKALAFTLSAALAGVAGGVLAPLIMFISPESFPFSQSILFVAAVIVGGSATVFGPLVGALLIVLLPELLSGLADLRLLLFGAMLLVVLWVAPQGILGWLSGTVGRRLREAGRRSPDAGDPASGALRAARGPARALPFVVPAHDGLRVSDIGIRFGGVTAADGVGFEAPAGRVTSLIGPNGAGKTTVLNLISGFYRPDTGSVALDADITGEPDWKIARRGLARTYQATRLFDELSVLDNLLVAMQRGRLETPLFRRRPDRDERARALLDFVGYAGPIDARADGLPHVDRRLVELARALATEPRVLLLDEPAAGLSGADTHELSALLRAIADAGVAVVLVEHDMSLVMNLSDRLVVLDSGATIAHGEPQEVRRDPKVIGAYLGDSAYRAPPRTNSLPASRTVLLDVTDLSVDYGAAPVVDALDLVVQAGETVAVLGANGAGKSSLLNAIAGLHPASSGTVGFDGRDIRALAPGEIAAAGLSLVPEGRQVFAELSVRDNLYMGAHVRSDRAAIDDDIERVLERFARLKDRLDTPAGLLSGGEQQMMAIGRGLMARPRLLLLDEPSLGLAPAMIGELYDALAGLRDEGVTLLLVDQMANLALEVADRAYVLETGRVVRSGGARELLADPALEAAYLGAHAA